MRAPCLLCSAVIVWGSRMLLKDSALVWQPSTAMLAKALSPKMAGQLFRKAKRNNRAAEVELLQV